MSIHETEWHADRDQLTAYVAGRAEPVFAASLETHLLGCADCRATLARAARTATGVGERSDTERRWDALAAVVDTPRSAPVR